MPFEKGRKKVGGRQKGTPNKKTELENMLLDKFLTKGSREVDKIWDGLKPREKADLLIKLLPFKKPQMARIESNQDTRPNITINMIAATKENVKQIDNTINIPHEEVDD